MKINHQFFMLITAIAALTGCSDDKKGHHGSSHPSLNKIWVFKKVDTAKSNLKDATSLWIGDNAIDMTNSDTLRYSTIATNNGTTAYTYKISDDYIYLDGKKTYKILKVTDTTMQISALYQVKNQNGVKKDSVVVVMDYKAR